MVGFDAVVHARAEQVIEIGLRLATDGALIEALEMVRLERPSVTALEFQLRKICRGRAVADCALRILGGRMCVELTDAGREALLHG